MVSNAADMSRATSKTGRLADNSQVVVTAVVLGFLLLSDYQSIKAFNFTILIVIKLHTQIGDDILHNRITVTDYFKVKS